MLTKSIPFNKPYFTGKEHGFISEVLASGQIGSKGKFTNRCQSFFEERYGFRKCYLTNSCTNALEMAAMVLELEPGDEILVPAFTYVSTANVFESKGLKVVLIDSGSSPNMDLSLLEAAITPRTKAIVVMHYSGIACDMFNLLELCQSRKLWLIEDAATCVDAFYIGVNNLKRALGSFGHVSTFSFHHTKNITSGEGGMLVVNDPDLVSSADLIWDRGTNRNAFLKGDVSSYNWIGSGGSFAPSELISAFLWAQCLELDFIQTKRKLIWEYYWNAFNNLANLRDFILPCIPSFASINWHSFYLIGADKAISDYLIQEMKRNGIQLARHYQNLGDSPYIKSKKQDFKYPNAQHFSENLIRLPLFVGLSEPELEDMIILIKKALK